MISFVDELCHINVRFHISAGHLQRPKIFSVSLDLNLAPSSLCSQNHFFLLPPAAIITDHGKTKDILQDVLRLQLKYIKQSPDLRSGTPFPYTMLPKLMGVLEAVGTSLQQGK